MKSTNHAQETQQDSGMITGVIDRFFQNFHLARMPPMNCSKGHAAIGERC